MRKLTCTFICASLLANSVATSALAESAIVVLRGGNGIQTGANTACQRQNGVLVCGAKASAEQELDGALEARTPRPQSAPRTVVIFDRANYRCLATQRYYPGIGCKRVRRFTQGFFADRIARGK